MMWQLRIALLLCMLATVVFGDSPLECRKPGAPKVEVIAPDPNARRSCSLASTRTVQQQWDQVYNAEDGGERRFIIVTEIFKNMFSTPTFKAHMMRLIVDLDLIINHLHDDGTLNEQLRHLSYKRNKYMGAHVGYYRAMTSALMMVLPEMTDQFDKLAWQSCLSFVGDTLTSAASQLKAAHYNNLPLCQTGVTSSDIEQTSSLPEYVTTMAPDDVKTQASIVPKPSTPRPKTRLYAGQKEKVIWDDWWYD